MFATVLPARWLARFLVQNPRASIVEALEAYRAERLFLAEATYRENF